MTARLPGDDPWPGARVQRLLALAADPRKYSAAEIAVRLGTSRNAVIGKLKRLKVTLPCAVSVPEPQQPAAAPPAPKAEPEPKPIALLPAFEPGLGSPAVAAIMALGPCSCRWPIGDPKAPGFRFCYARRSGGSPYCDAHGAVAFSALRMRRAAAEPLPLPVPA
jgi:GcrA cell cycle regulator